MFAVKVEPHRAILEPDYFQKMIEIAEQTRDDEIERNEAGVPEEKEDEEAEAELIVEEQKESAESTWEELQSMPNDQYLQKTILPVLYQGMKILDQQRPIAPSEYLAMYLLKHQDKIKLPQKPVDE